MQESRGSFQGWQSSRANGPCKQTVTVSVTRVVSTGVELSGCSEQCGGGHILSDFHSAVASLSTIPRLCLSWLKKAVRKEGTTKSCQTASHLTCALQSEIAPLPPIESHSPLTMKGHPKGHPDALSWCCFWGSDVRPICSPFPLLFTLNFRPCSQGFLLAITILSRLLWSFLFWSDHWTQDPCKYYYFHFTDKETEHHCPNSMPWLQS